MRPGDVVTARDGHIGGMMTGGVCVGEGAGTRISGMVSGRIFNDGGAVRISGMVGG